MDRVPPKKAEQPKEMVVPTGAPTQRLHSSSFLGLPYGLLNIKPQHGTTMEPTLTPNNLPF